MMADDPRHGTTPGYHAGCRESCCRRAIARYEKQGRLASLQGGRAVPALGSQRRIHALMRLGWTSADIAEAVGWTHRNHVLRIINGQKGKPTTWLERKTAASIRTAYEKLSMQIPEPSPCRARTRARAIRLGYAPPLSWDCIDTDPSPRDVADRSDELDPVVVDRLLDLKRVPSTQAEKFEAMRRWLAMGRPESQLCFAHGWKDGRYTERVDGAA